MVVGGVMVVVVAEVEVVVTLEVMVVVVVVGVAALNERTGLKGAVYRPAGGQLLRCRSQPSLTKSGGAASTPHRLLHSTPLHSELQDSLFVYRRSRGSSPHLHTAENECAATL